jgi:multiple sugar transport system permease protein
MIAYEMAFTIFPLAYSAILSFTRYIPPAVSTPKFTGLDNYIQFFTDARMYNAYAVTLTFVVVAVLLEFFIGLGLALTLNEEFHGNLFFRLLLIVPLFALPLAMGYMFQIVFYGAGGLNQLLGLFHLPAVNWTSDPNIAIYSIISIDVWEWTPFCTLVLLAGLQSLPREPYEAAVVDGASSTSLFRYVTIPMLSPIIATVVLLRIIEAFKVFDIIFALTGGGPGSSTESLTLYGDRIGLTFFNWGYSSTMTLMFLATVLIVCSMLLRRFGEPFWS